MQLVSIVITKNGDKNDKVIVDRFVFFLIALGLNKVLQIDRK